MNILRLSVALQLAALVVVALALAGCGHAPVRPEREVVFQEKRVPVPVPCDAKRPELAPYPDTAEALRSAPDIFARVQLLLEARKLRPSNEAKLRAYGDGCAGKAGG